jgi:large subunit ribosomal protein L30
MAENLKITLFKSVIGALPKQRLTVAALGLRKTNSSVVKRDDPATRGMIRKIAHMVRVEEI